ncbi:hypothetical protein SME06J_35830 [Serratia marcescens]|nr:hypothetical protein SME06J_35830 [Serratia marcescens]
MVQMYILKVGRYQKRHRYIRRNLFLTVLFHLALMMNFLKAQGTVVAKLK